MRSRTLDWLLEPEDPPIRFHTLRDILGRSSNDPEVKKTRDRIRDYRPVKKLLKMRTRDGYWPPVKTCYRPKWTSTVWPLMLLGEMGFPPDEGVKAACERFLDLHQLDNGSFACPSKLERIKKRWEEPCLTGNMIRTLIAFGYGDDPRVKKAINWLPEHQLEDGGWNCNYPEKKVKHSSFMSTIEPLWAYSEIPRAKWTRRMKRSMERASEFMLMHRLYKRDHHEWRPMSLWDKDPTIFHFPMYYYYDVLHGLRVLTNLGYGDDERTSDAVHLLISKRTPEGKWLLDGDWHREGDPQKRKTIVDLEQLWKPSKWVTLNCYRALTKTGDLEVRGK